MHPHSFDYRRPESLDGAVGLLREHGDRAKVLAGGQSLIPLMKLRLASPAVLIDLGRVPGLSILKEDGEFLRIGAMTRHRDLERTPLIRERYPLLADAARVLGDPQVRNLGTIGGSIAHADPAGDWGAALLAFDAKVLARGHSGERTIPIDEFFKDTFATALKAGEILTEVRLPKPGARAGGAYAKLKRKTGDFATVAAAAQLELDGGGKLMKVRIGLAAVGATPVRARHAEDALRGTPADTAHLAEAAKLAVQDAKPTPDLRGSAEYKRAMVEVFTRRALERAVERARGRGA
ncbi:MAG: FAD binding domain-containing protein [Methanobacteriota archaeon]